MIKLPIFTPRGEVTGLLYMREADREKLQVGRRIKVMAVPAAPSSPHDKATAKNEFGVVVLTLNALYHGHPYRPWAWMLIADTKSQAVKAAKWLASRDMLVHVVIQ